MPEACAKRFHLQIPVLGSECALAYSAEVAVGGRWGVGHGAWGFLESGAGRNHVDLSLFCINAPNFRCVYE